MDVEPAYYSIDNDGLFVSVIKSIGSDGTTEVDSGKIHF